MKLVLYTLLTSDFSIEESIALAVKCGFDAVDIRMHESGIHLVENVSLQETARIKALVDEAGLEVSGVSSYFSIGVEEESWGQMRQGLEYAMDVCKTLGGKFLRCSGPKVLINDSYETARQLFRKQAIEINELARQKEIILTAEQHCITLFSSAGQVLDMMRDLNLSNLGIVFDPANSLLEGYERSSIQITMLQDLIKAVHVKNFSTKEATEIGLYDSIPVLEQRLDQGLLNWPQIISQLKKSGYDGYITLEDFAKFDTVEEKLLWDRQYLQELI